jgi:hypothetical protein
MKVDEDGVAFLWLGAELGGESDGGASFVGFGSVEEESD